MRVGDTDVIRRRQLGDQAPDPQWMGGYDPLTAVRSRSDGSLATRATAA